MVLDGDLYVIGKYTVLLEWMNRINRYLFDRTIFLNPTRHKITNGFLIDFSKTQLLQAISRFNIIHITQASLRKKES